MSINTLIKQAQSLPVAKKEEWALGQKALNVFIDEMEDSNSPELHVCISPKKGIIGSNVIARNTPDAEVLQWAIECMTSPMEGNPRRPGIINITGDKLTHLKTTLEQLGIKVIVAESPHPAIDGLAAELERTFNSPGLPPYTIDTDYENTDILDSFFESTAEYYKQKPWKCFDDELPLKIDVQIKGKQVTYWAIIMGTCGESYGLSLYKTYEDLAELLEADGPEEALDVIQSIWSMSVNFVNIKDIGPISRQELTANDWILANKSAYPSALVTDPEEIVNLRLPTAEEMESLGAVIHALAMFFKDNRRRIKAHLNTVGSFLTSKACLLRRNEEIPVCIYLPAPEYMEDLADFLNDPFGEECDGDLLGLIGNRPKKR